jgi:rhodanese-related sulfurtransferase
MKLVRPLGIGALALGLAAPFAGSPYCMPQGGLDLDAIARAIDDGTDHVSARQLAQWIRDRRPGLRVIDVRSPTEFHEGAIPTAENLPIGQLVKSHFAPEQTIVLVSQEGAHAGQAWVMLRSLGVINAVFVPGGLADWREEVLSPVLPTNASPAERARIAELSHYFGGAPRIVGGQQGDVASAAQIGRGSRRRGC